MIRFPPDPLFSHVSSLLCNLVFVDLLRQERLWPMEQGSDQSLSGIPLSAPHRLCVFFFLHCFFYLVILILFCFFE